MATIFCKNLGYTQGGVVERERKSYNEDAFIVGTCNSDEITDLENGCTKYNDNLHVLVASWGTLQQLPKFASKTYIETSQ